MQTINRKYYPIINDLIEDNSIDEYHTTEIPLYFNINNNFITELIKKIWKIC